MTKMKITTLTDKTGDDDIVLRLKSLGVKVKDKQKADLHQEDKKEAASQGSEIIVEKRIAATVIRRRVTAPPPPPAPPAPPPPTTETPKAKSDDVLKKEKPAEKVPHGTQRETGAATAEKAGRPQKGTTEKKEAARLDATIEVEKGKVETPPPPIPETSKEVVKPRASRTTEKKEHPEDISALEATQEGYIQFRKEDLFKGESEIISEGKEKEITKVLQDAYKQDLDKGIVLGEDEEARKKKKAEKLSKQIEEQETVDGKLKKKGILKRKVIIKEEDQYSAKKQKGRPFPSRRDKRDRFEDRRHEEEKKTEAKPAKKIIKMGTEISVGELAKRMGVKAQEVIGKLLGLGIISAINQNIDFDTAFLVASELGFEMEKTLSIEEEFFAKEDEQKDAPELLKHRPPVVTIMGHVDHGKTLLLDTIRNTNVAEREAGGITQHIGAYKVTLDGKKIVFIDTPGHEAFTSMRARGALVTDIVILVVAADDGVMPQTEEAINHAKSADVPIIVAINKIDKENANIDRVLRDLAEHGLIPEEWGGSTLFAKISAKKNIGIKELLELIVLQAEILELKANPNKLAKGTIIESRLDKGHGPVGTVIIQEGTLKIHDPFIAGNMFGRVRAMIDDKGNKIMEAPPSTPIVVVGFQDVPQGGDTFIVTTEERYARELSKFRQVKLREQEINKSSRTTLEDLYSRIGETDRATLNVIIKGDVRGTIDAIVESLKRLSNDRVEILVVHSGAGAINETDINLAIATGSIIVGFNSKPVGKAQTLAEHEKVQIRTYSVIYELIDDIKKAMEGLLAPVIVETPIGKAEVRKIYTVSKIGTIAGSYVTEGKVTRNALVKVLRNNSALFTGKLSSLKRFKDDAKEVLAGYECGISLDGFNDLQEGDVLDFYVEEKEAQTLDG